MNVGLNCLSVRIVWLGNRRQC